MPVTIKELTPQVYAHLKKVGASKTASEDIARTFKDQVLDLLEIEFTENPKPRPACADKPLSKSSSLKQPHRNSMKEYLSFWIPKHLMDQGHLTSAAYLALIKYCESRTNPLIVELEKLCNTNLEG